MAEAEGGGAPEAGEGGEADAPQEERKRTIGKYDMGIVLGAGAFCKVRLGTHQETKDQVAIKIVDKGHIESIKDLERVMREMHVLKNLQHPNIISMHEAIEKGTRIYMIIDYAEGGELYDYIMSKGPINEREARAYFGQIMSGVDFFHRQKISHRDLKPENVLMVKQGAQYVCKVADFGLSNDMVMGDLLKTTCGTPAYAAPEMTLGQKYDGVLVDVWAAGATLFTMVVGRIPFSADSQPELFKKIQAASFTVPASCTPEVTDLIRKLMTVVATKRISLAQAWQHPWLSSNNRFAELEEEAADKGEEEGEGDRDAAGDKDKVEGDKALVAADAMPLPEVMLELLPHHHLPSNLVAGSTTDTDNISYLQVTIDPTKPSSTPGAAEHPPPNRPPATTASPTPSKVTLFILPKEARSDPAGKTPLSSLGSSSVAASSPLSASSTKPLSDPSSRRPPPSGGGGTTAAASLARRGAAAAAAASGASSSSSLSSAPITIPKSRQAGASGGGRDTGSSPAKGSITGSSPTPTSLTNGGNPAKAANATKNPPAGDAAGGGGMSAAAAAAASKKAKLESAALCTIISKEPRGVLREAQKLFSDYKVLLRSASPTSLKGEKNRVRFEINVTPIAQVGKTDVKEDLYLVHTNRLAGDVVAFRDVCRRLLIKL